MNGLSILHSVKNDPQLSRLPIIAITGNVQREHLQNTLAAGFDGVIVKPIDQEEMIMILLRLTQSRKGSGEWPSFPAEEMNSLDTSGEFPSISGIDSRKAATALANDRELFLDLLRQFANDCGDAAERIRDDLKQGNQEAAASQLHNLRGALGLLGAVELIKSVQDVEKSIHTSRPDLDQRLNTFMAVFASFKKAIAPWVKK